LDQEELLDEFVKGPSKSAARDEEPSHIIGPASKNDSYFEAIPKLNKHGLEIRDL